MAASRLAALPVVLRRLARSTADPALRDDALLARFTANRDEEAFAELVRRHGPMVLAVCRRLLRDEHLAEDAVDRREQSTGQLCFNRRRDYQAGRKHLGDRWHQHAVRHL